MSLNPGESSDRLEVLPLQSLEDQTFLTQLRISNVQESDVEMDVTLLVANNIGQNEFSITLALPAPDPFIDPPNDSPKTSTIVTIVLICALVVLIGIGVGIYYCHKNGALCFKRSE